MLLEILIDAGAILMAVIGIIGCIIPAIPGPPLTYASLLLLYLLNNPQDEITGKFMIIWIAVVVAVLPLSAPDYLVAVAAVVAAVSIGA